jgi:hypothetical protein
MEKREELKRKALGFGVDLGFIMRLPIEFQIEALEIAIREKEMLAEKSLLVMAATIENVYGTKFPTA